MNKIFVLFVCSFLISSCASFMNGGSDSYQLVELEKEYNIYSKANESSEKITTAGPKDSVYMYLSSTKRGYRKVRYKNNYGWIYRPDFRSYGSTRHNVSNQSTGGSVHVKGYYRKDGTYVKPHTRKSPTRKR